MCNIFCCRYTYVGVVHVSVGTNLNVACLNAPEVLRQRDQVGEMARRR